MHYKNAKNFGKRKFWLAHFQSKRKIYKHAKYLIVLWLNYVDTST